jgi:hypothetical protein
MVINCKKKQKLGDLYLDKCTNYSIVLLEGGGAEVS